MTVYDYQVIFNSLNDPHFPSFLNRKRYLSVFIAFSGSASFPKLHLPTYEEELEDLPLLLSGQSISSIHRLCMRVNPPEDVLDILYLVTVDPYAWPQITLLWKFVTACNGFLFSRRSSLRLLSITFLSFLWVEGTGVKGWKLWEYERMNRGVSRVKESLNKMEIPWICVNSIINLHRKPYFFKI